MGVRALSRVLAETIAMIDDRIVSMGRVLKTKDVLKYL